MKRIGGVELHLLSDGTFAVDAGGIFGLVPKLLWGQFFEVDESNRMDNALACLLIIDEGKRILVDTGLGSKLPQRELELHGIQRPNGGLEQDLARHGLAPADIDIVINTHLHWDHAGGNTMLRDGQAVPTFPNAQYWVQRLEWADAMYPNERTRNTYYPSNLLPILESGRLKLLSGDTRVTPHVRTAISRGHTRAHQSVYIESEGESAIFLGDLASMAIRLERLGWMSAFDTEPLETLESKRSVRDWALEHNALLVFQHDSGTLSGRLTRQGESWQVVPEAI